MVSEVRLKFLKFATNLAILLRSCQSNHELGNKVVNSTPNFIGKLTSSLQEKFASFGEIVITDYFKMDYNYETLQLNSPRSHLTPA